MCVCTCVCHNNTRTIPEQSYTLPYYCYSMPAMFAIEIIMTVLQSQNCQDYLILEKKLQYTVHVSWNVSLYSWILHIHCCINCCTEGFCISQAALSTLLFLTVCTRTVQGSSQTGGPAQTGSQAGAQGNTDVAQCMYTHY